MRVHAIYGTYSNNNITVSRCNNPHCSYDNKDAGTREKKRVKPDGDDDDELAMYPPVYDTKNNNIIITIMR